MTHRKHEAIGYHVTNKFILSLATLAAGIGVLIVSLLWAGDARHPPGDRAGQEALRIWTQRERDRAMAEAARRYWDYWLSKPSRRSSAHRLWWELERTQRWLKDPQHRVPPPPPPPYRRHFHSYYFFPYYYPNYPPPYYWPPPVFQPPYYMYPSPYETYDSGEE
jgi:hypothetical protein